MGVKGVNGTKGGCELLVGLGSESQNLQGVSMAGVFKEL